MNKLTLSAAALTAIVAPAQMQAATITDEQKTAKQEAIEALRIQLNAVLNEIKANCPDVQETYLAQLSAITADMNEKLADDSYALTGDEKWGAQIDNIKTTAAKKQEPYDAKKKAEKAYETLKAAYDAAIADCANYPAVGKKKIEALKQIGVEEIGKRIAALNPANGDTDANLEGDIDSATKQIEEQMKNIAKEEMDAANNDSAHNSVVTAYNDAKAYYDVMLEEAIKQLPSKGTNISGVEKEIYKDWQDAAIAELNEQYRILNEAKRADEAAWKAGNAGGDEFTKNINAINGAAAKIQEIVSGYVYKMQYQEMFKANAKNDIQYLQNRINVMKTALADRNLTECDADINAAQGLIDALKKSLDNEYETHAMKNWSWDPEYYKIISALNEVDNDGNPPYKYADVIDNYDAYKAMSEVIAKAQENLNNNVKAAEKASKDGKYNAAAYFTGDQTKVQNDINTLTSAVENAYKTKTAVTYQSDTFDSKNNPITTANANYAANTAAALAAYDSAQQLAADTQKALDELSAAVADKTATIDGTLNGKTYEKRISEIQAEIDKINSTIAAALKLQNVDKHLPKIQEAAKLTVSDDIQTLKDNYKTNKAEFDKASAIKAAENVLATSKDRIDAVQKTIDEIMKDKDGNDYDFGNQSTAINEAKDAVQKDLDDVSGIRDAAETEFNNDKNTESAAKAIETLNKVNEELGNMEDALKDLAAKATAAKDNKKAYDDLMKLINDPTTGVNALIAEARTEVETKATGDAFTHYIGEVSKLVQEVAAQEDAIVKAYNEGKSVANKEEIAKKLEGISNAAKDLKKAVVPNENAFKAQDGAVDALKDMWKETYDNISNKDLSDAAAGYLADLAKELEKINTFKNTTIPEAFGKGESVAQDNDIKESLKNIEDKITEIANASNDNYDANVDATNAAQHSNFEEAYKTANTAFSDAVKALNQFSGIKNEAVKTALDNLITTHDNIYAYADKLRNLKSLELADYTKYVNDKTDGVDDIYNAKKWIDEAVKFTGDINKLITDYQNEVNQVAYDTYNKNVKSAASKLGKAQAAIESFVYDGKATAFKDVEDIVNEAQTAGAIDTDGTIKDKFYAVKMDKWLETLDNVDKMLEADRDAACEAEKAKRVDDAKALYNSERDEIAQFGEIDSAEYLKKLDELKEAKIDVAEAAEPTLDNTIDVIIAKCEEYATYSLKDGKFVLGHSSVYNEAYDASVASQKNIEAYNRMVEAVDLLVSDFDDVKASVDKLIVGHQDGDTYAALTSIVNDLESAKSGLEETKAAGGCVKFEASKFVVFKSSIITQIESLKETALSEEIGVLNSKIDEVKEEYNQVAKEDLDAVKGYDEKIQALYDAVKDIKDKLKKEKDPSTMFDGAVDALAEQEVAIAALNQELNSKYENTQTADAVAAVNAAIEKAEAAVAQAEAWAGYNDATKAFAEAEVQALRGELELIKADYEAKNAAGQLLFYQDNILFELGNVANDAPAKGSDLETLYNKHVANDNVYNELSATLKADTEALAAAYDKIKDFEHKKAIHEVDLIESLKKGIEDDFAALGEDLETMHKNVELTETGDINNDINELSSRIYDLERGAKAYEAMGSINDLVKSIDASLNVVNNSQYGGDRQAKLTEEYNRINGLLTKAESYNNDAVDGWIGNDIDGNDVRELINGYKYDIAIDYNTDAWNSLQTRIAELKADAEQLAKDVVELSFIAGDADNDKRVTVNDYSEVRNWILTATKFEDVDEAKRYAGDCNGDEEFTVADMTGVSNIIFHGEWNWSPENAAPAKTRAKANAEDVLSITNEGEETTIFGKTVRMAINLTHSEAFIAGQMDIIMPQGMKIAGQSMSDRANGHDIFASNIGNGVTRIVTATIDNNEFVGRSGALIYLDVEVGSDYNGGQIVVENAIFSDAGAKSYSIAPGEGDATGIGNIKAATVKERIYSVGGQVMKTVKKGINIIVGEDGKARKVVNK